MVIRAESINERLKELDRTVQELSRYRQVKPETLHSNLSQRWVIERGLIAAASLILEIADHILAGHFGIYASTYEDSLKALQANGVISDSLFEQIKGLGGFRNILVHGYLGIDVDHLASNFQKGLIVFPLFAQEIVSWLDASVGP